MTAATAQMITIDREELRDITVDVSAMVEYMNDLLATSDDGIGTGPEMRLQAINHRLEGLLGLIYPADGPEPPIEVQEEDDAMFQEASVRGTEWFTEDRDAIYQMVGRKVAGCLRFFD
jgi:hypothetical protein